MPLNSKVVGETSRCFKAVADARWLMAYSAACLSDDDALFDTGGSRPIISHPLFPVCLEWMPLQDLVNAPYANELTADELARNVHASLDLRFERPIRPGECLSTRATIIGAEKKGNHVLQRLKVDTEDCDGKLVCRSYQSGIFLDTRLDGQPKAIEQAPGWPAASKQNEGAGTATVDLPRGLPHLYSEASRIWNPIHTDRAHARGAGLGDIILHGTATLAIAVTQLAQRVVPGGFSSIDRVAGRFSAMVPVPSKMTVRIDEIADRNVHFSVTNQAGQLAIRDGFCSFGKGFPK